MLGVGAPLLGVAAVHGFPHTTATIAEERRHAPTSLR